MIDSQISNGFRLRLSFAGLRRMTNIVERLSDATGSGQATDSVEAVRSRSFDCAQDDKKGGGRMI